MGGHGDERVDPGMGGVLLGVGQQLRDLVGLQVEASQSSFTWAGFSPPAAIWRWISSRVWNGGFSSPLG